MRIVVTGAGGQLGRALDREARQHPGNEWSFLTRSDLDLLDAELVYRMIRFHRPEVVINTAAYTAVDRAESEPDAAFALNERAVRILAGATAEAGARLIHLSTDYVYDNGQTTPYRESDPMDPKSVYARSKLAGETAALGTNPDTLIVRTSWLYSRYGGNFLDTMLRLGEERESLGVVFDQVGSPTSAHDLARALIHMIRQIGSGVVLESDLRGVMNFSNEGVCSWYDLAVRIMAIRRLPCRVVPIRTETYPTPARRPAYSVMDKARFSSVFDYRIPHWVEALERCMRDLEMD